MVAGFGKDSYFGWLCYTLSMSRLEFESLAWRPKLEIYYRRDRKIDAIIV